jgi:integrase
MFTRTSYQSGSLRKVSRKRGPAVWEYRWYDTAPQGGKRPYRKLQVGTVDSAVPIQPAVERAGVGKHVSWHTFRHSFATLLKANGEDIKTVQESLRQSTLRIAMETYTQAVPEHIRLAHNKIAGQLIGMPAATDGVATEALVAP